jgi:bacteriorhodopsin
MDRETIAALWIIGIIMTAGLFAFSIRAFSIRKEAKLFYYSFVIITLVGALSHFAMASGLGSMRQGDHIVFFARSIDWVITTPLLLLNVALIALPRVPERTQLIVVLLGADILMIITGSIGTFIPSDGRWGWFGASTLGFVIIFYIIAQFSREARLRGSEVARLYSLLSKWIIALWVCYPVVLILGNEGLGIISLFIETVLLGILDMCAKIGSGYILLSHSSALLQAEMTGSSSTGS